MKRNRKINILYLSAFDDLDGGAQLCFIRLIENIKDRFSIIVLVPRKGSLYDRLLDLNIKTYIANVSYWWHPTKRHYSYIFLSEFERRVAQVLNIIKKHRIDIVHTNHIWAIDGAIAASIAEIPHVWHVRCIMTNHPLFKQDFPLQTSTFARLIGELSDRVVAVSSATKQSLIPYILPEKIDVIHDGVALETFRAEKHTSGVSIRQELKLPNNTLLVCAIGRIEEIKGFDDFVSASAKISLKRQDVRFLLVGSEDDAPLVLSLKKKVFEMGLEGKFFFLGFRKDVPEILKESDICVSTSLAEGCPNVVIEAMAASKPVVATRSGGSEDIVVNRETGFLVGVKKPNEIAEHVLKLLDNKELREKMGRQSELLVRENFSNEHYVQSCESLYDKLHQNKVRGNSVKSSDGSIWPEMIVNFLSEIGELRLKSIEFEERIKKLENFEALFKDNLIYKGTRNIYHLLSRLLNKK